MNREVTTISDIEILGTPHFYTTNQQMEDIAKQNLSQRCQVYVRLRLLLLDSICFRAPLYILAMACLSTPTCCQ